MLTKQSLIKEVVTLYGDFETDENLLVSQIVDEWYERKIREYFKPILDSLKEVEVVLGARTWEVKKFGKDYNEEELIEEHKEMYSEDVIKGVFDVWKWDEIMLVSEKILNS